MRPQDVWNEFLMDGDIAKAGRRVFHLARNLRIEVLGYLHGGDEAGARSPRARREIRRDVIVKPRVWRVPRRYPVRRELLGAFEWVGRKLREVARSLSVHAIARWDLLEEMRRVKEKISSFRRRGRRVVALYELVGSRGEFVPTLVSLLFMEREGDVELLQRRPFDEVYVVLSNEGSGVVGEGKKAP